MLEVLGLVLPLLGATSGALIGSYLATHWTEKRRIKRDHWEEIKNKVLSHLLDHIKNITTMVKNKVSTRGFSYLVNGKYPLIDKIEFRVEDHKLYEISIKKHFPDLAANLDKFNENIEKYNENYVTLIQREHEFLVKRGYENRYNFLKIFVYRLLDVDIEKVRKISRQAIPDIDDKDTGALNQLLGETLEDRKQSESDLINSINELSKEIVSQANKIKNDLEVVIRLPKLKGECELCKIDLF